MEVTKKKEQKEQGQEGKKPGIDPAIIEELMKDYQRPEDLTGPGGILEELHKRLYERVLGAELTHYLGYAKGEAPKQEEGQRRENHRNGSSKKTLISEEGKLEIEAESLNPSSSAKARSVLEDSIPRSSRCTPKE